MAPIKPPPPLLRRPPAAAIAAFVGAPLLPRLSRPELDILTLDARFCLIKLYSAADGLLVHHLQLQAVVHSNALQRLALHRGGQLHVASAVFQKELGVQTVAV